MKNLGLNERVMLRGIEGLIADEYLRCIVEGEWKDASQSDEALFNQLEAKYMAEQIYAIAKGWTK